MPTDSDTMTLAETADALGLTTPAMIFNWIMDAAPPRAYLTAEGGWQFQRAEVDAVIHRLAALREANALGVVTLPDVDDDSPLPLL